MKNPVFTLFVFLIVLLSNTAFAKKVSIKWKPIEGASKYEILIEKEDKKILSKILEETEWDGNLKFGVYTYQIRGIDSVNREGVWSESRPLVVMALKPDILKPTNDEITAYSKNYKIPFEWSSQPGVSEYEVTINKDGKQILKTEVSGTKYEYPATSNGKYVFQVSPILKNKSARKLASANKQWSGSSTPFEFNVELKELKAPEITYPKGKVFNPGKKTITLKWKKVDGAEKYVIKLTSGRSIANYTEKTLQFESKDTSIDVPVDPSKNYSYDVHAVNNGEPGAKSTAEFSIDTSAEFPEKSGYIALSSLYSPYTYEIYSSADSVKGSFSSKANSLRISKEYFPYSNYGIGAAVQNTSFQIKTKQYDNMDFELTGRYRKKFGDQALPWYFYPKVGFESRSNVELVPTVDLTTNTLQVNSTTAYKIRTIGAQVGFDLRKQMTKKFSLGMKLNYFSPLSIVSPTSGQSLLGTKNNRNLSIGLQLSYWLYKKLGLAFGGFYDQRSISFSRTTSSGKYSEDYVIMDATYYFISLIYVY